MGFKVGDRCIILPIPLGKVDVKFSMNIGKICVLELGPLYHPSHASSPHRMLGWDVQVEGGLGCWVAEIYLQKLPPPKEETSSWEEIQKITGWNPLQPVREKMLDFIH